jgi:hypothetical protein
MSALAVPVVIVGHDACDGGGMTGASCDSATAVNQTLLVQASSTKGFVLWQLSVRIAAAGTHFLRLRIGEALPVTNPPQAVAFLRPQRDVNVTGNNEPTAGLPGSAAAWTLPIQGGNLVNVVQFSGRPLVVQPNEIFAAWSSLVAGGTMAFQLLFEEGL